MDINALVEPVMGSIGNYYQSLSNIPGPPCTGPEHECVARGYTSPFGNVLMVLLALAPIALPIAISSKLF